MAIELLEKGRVRFWTEVEKFTSGCQVEYVFNDAILSEGEVGLILRKEKTSLVFCPLPATHGFELRAFRNTQ